MAILLLVVGRKIVERATKVGMVGWKLLLGERQRALEQGLGFGIALLALIERGQIVELGRDRD